MALLYRSSAFATSLSLALLVKDSGFFQECCIYLRPEFGAPQFGAPNSCFCELFECVERRVVTNFDVGAGQIVVSSQ